MKKHARWSTIVLFYLVSLAVCTLALYVVLGLHNYDLRIPFSSGGDVRLSSFICKTLVDNPWYYENKFTGAPDATLLYDYPAGGDNLNLVVLKVIALVTKNYATTLNSFFLLTFFLIVTAAYFSSIAMGLRPYFALALSVLYAFMPYHFLRAQSHMFLSSYFCIPISVYLMSIIHGSIGLDSERLRLPVILPLLVVVGSTGAYYAVFSLFLFVTAGVFGFMKTRQKTHIYRMLLFCASVSFVLVANLSPSIIYHFVHGQNDAAVARSYIAAEIYAFKISQLFLPLGGHRIGVFSRVGSGYNQVISSEGPAYIGLIGIAGFLVLLFSLVPLDRPIQSRERAHIRFLAIQNIASILLATVGGFGALIAYKVSSYIRAYNRISIVIAYMSLMCAFFLIQIWHNHLRDRLKNRLALLAVSIALSAFFLVLGMFDETQKSYRPNLAANAAIFRNEEEFVQRIENDLPSIGAMIFQLPYVPFPENPPVNKMVDYQHFTGYLHSNHLRWSYGAMKGRETAKLDEEISALPPEDMVDYLSFATGFSGIYIDLNGYPDSAEDIIVRLTKKLDEKPMTSADGTRIFFDLTSFREHSIDSQQLASIKLKLVNNTQKVEGQYQIGTAIGFADDRFLGRGWSSNEGTHRWSEGKHAEILFKLGNVNVKNQFSLVFSTVMTIGNQRVQVSVNAKKLGEKTVVNKADVEFAIPRNLLRTDGNNVISFDLPDARPPGTADSRVLGIALGYVRIQESSTK